MALCFFLVSQSQENCTEWSREKPGLLEAHWPVHAYLYVNISHRYDVPRLHCSSLFPKKGAQLDFQSDTGATALIQASLIGNVDVVNMLLDAGEINSKEQNSIPDESSLKHCFIEYEATGVFKSSPCSIGLHIWAIDYNMYPQICTASSQFALCLYTCIFLHWWLRSTSKF